MKEFLNLNIPQFHMAAKNMYNEKMFHLVMLDLTTTFCTSVMETLDVLRSFVMLFRGGERVRKFTTFS